MSGCTHVNFQLSMSCCSRHHQLNFHHRIHSYLKIPHHLRFLLRCQIHLKYSLRHHCKTIRCLQSPFYTFGCMFLSNGCQDMSIHCILGHNHISSSLYGLGMSQQYILGCYRCSHSKHISSNCHILCTALS